MLEIELLAQTGALMHGLAALRRRRQMLARLAQLGWLGPEDARRLGDALARLGALQQVIRLAAGRTIDPAEGGKGLVRLVLASTDAPELDTLRETLQTEAEACAAIVTARLEGA